MSVKLRFSAVLVGLCLLAFGSPGFAQGGITPIQIGQNAIGTLTADVRSALFALTATSGETATIQVLALSPGFVPHFSVVNPEGVEILTVANPNGQATLAGNATFDEAGVYVLVVTGENGSVGQFALSLQPGAALPEATTLTINQPVVATVGGQTPVQVYRFDTTSLGVIAIIVQSQTPEAGPLVTLYSESTGKTIASNDAGVIGATYLLPAAGGLYRVEVSAVGSGDTVFSICLGSCGNSLPAGNTTAPPIQAIPPTPTTEAAICTAASSVGGTANLRSGPGTTYAILSGLPVGQTAQVLAEWKGVGWYEVSFNGAILWVGGSVVNLSGDCSTLPKIAAPTNAPLAPTPVPTARPPVSTPEVQPTEMPTQAQLPDLTVQGMTITQDSPTHARVTFDIYNIGTVDVTQPFYVYVCITTLCVEKQITLPVRAGNSTEVYVDLNHPSSTTPETVAVAVDSRGEIAELNENNNTTSLADVSLSF